MGKGTAATAWVTKWLVGTLWTVLVAVIMFMGNVVRTNDLSNRENHKEIIKGSVERNASQQVEIEHVKEIVTDIRLEQRSLKADVKYGFAMLEKKL